MALSFAVYWGQLKFNELFLINKVEIMLYRNLLYYHYILYYKYTRESQPNQKWCCTGINLARTKKTPKISLFSVLKNLSKVQKTTSFKIDVQRYVCTHLHLRIIFCIIICIGFNNNTEN